MYKLYETECIYRIYISKNLIHLKKLINDYYRIFKDNFVK